MTAANDNGVPLGVPLDDPSAKTSKPATRPCPICGRPASETMRPFCSKRCADVDLHRWLGGRYAVPAAPDDDTGEQDA